MNKIEELIQQFCPEGVAYKELGKCSKVVRGKRVTKSQLKDDKKYPVISGGFKPLGFFDEFNREPETITIAQYGSAGFIALQNKKFWANDVCYSVYPNNELNNRFLFFVLINQQDYIYSLKTNAIPAHLPQNLLEKAQIPIPPLPIQQEIVSILDKFTTLEARRAQYKYYRDQLLCFEGNEVEWKMLGEVGEFIRGRRFVKDDIVSEGVPCIHYGELYTHYNIWAKEAKSFLNADLAAKLRVARTGDVVIVSAGETIEDIGNGVAWLGDSDVVIHDACFAYRHSMNPKYVSYYLQTNLFRSQIKKYISSGKISSINSPGLSKAKIPIPPMEEQERIVKILDKFNALVNDISVGIPAEIKARRKQYEYYRGKLLDFKPLNN